MFVCMCVRMCMRVWGHVQSAGANAEATHVRSTCRWVLGSCEPLVYVLRPKCSPLEAQSVTLNCWAITMAPREIFLNSRDVAQWVNGLATKSDSRVWASEPPGWKERADSLKLSSALRRGSVAQVHVYPNIVNICKSLWTGVFFGFQWITAIPHAFLQKTCQRKMFNDKLG